MKIKTFKSSTRPSFQWVALISLITLLFGVLVSTQEKVCKFSSSEPTVSFETRTHSAQQHSQHCLRHQPQLPESDSPTQSFSTGLDALVAKIESTLFFGRPFYKPRIISADFSIQPHQGQPIYKFFAHFLI